MQQEIKPGSLKLTKVVLYKHGIGYFERRGKVVAPSKLELVCEPSEIDDMLKSLLAISEGGRVDAITYDSSKTLESRLAEFGFDLTRTQGLCGLLAQMTGIPVTITVSGETLSGRVLGLDTTEQVVRDSVVHESLLTLYSQESTFKRIPLSSISSIRVDDESMATEMRQQLELLFQNAKKKDRKALTVTVSGEGDTNLLIAYSIPCPIWKTSYRLVMDTEQTILQGMAIVDNVQEEDWTEVQVILVSAAPISFIQPLYDPVLPARRVIATQGFVSAGPVTAERARRQRAPEPPMPASPMMYSKCDLETLPRIASMRADEAMFEDSFGEAPEPALGALMGAAAVGGISVEAAGSGEQFEYKISAPVTVPRNSSALLPIVQQAVEGERISLYNQASNAKFPHAAVRFKNTTGLTLEAGPVTVMESETYAGEALLDTVKPNDTRYLLYAVDQSLPVVVRMQSENRPIWRVRAANGAIYMDYCARTGRIYQVDSLADKAKKLYIEHPLMVNWKLSGAQEPAEVTDTYYRFLVEIEPGTSKELEVWEESETFQMLWLTSAERLDVTNLEWICGQNFVNDEFVRFVKKILEMAAELAELRGQIAEKRTAIEEHSKDQKRARENLESMGANNERFRRLIDTAEDRIEKDRSIMNELQLLVAEKSKEYQKLAMRELISELDLAGSKQR